MPSSLIVTVLPDTEAPLPETLLALSLRVMIVLSLRLYPISLSRVVNILSSVAEANAAAVAVSLMVVSSVCAALVCAVSAQPVSNVAASKTDSVKLMMRLFIMLPPYSSPIFVSWSEDEISRLPFRQRSLSMKAFSLPASFKVRL